MTRKEEKITTYQNLCATVVIIGITLFAGAGNEITAIIAIILIIAGSIGISACDKKLKKEGERHEKI